jgi:hypothetical protein
MDFRTGKEPFNCFTKIGIQMPPIRDLDRLWSTLGHSIHVVDPSISTNHFDLWVVSQPGTHRLHASIRQQIQHLLPLQIHDDGAVALTTAPAPIVDPNHPHFVCFKGGPVHRLYRPEDGRIGGSHPEGRRQPLTTLAATAKSNLLQSSTEACREA